MKATRSHLERLLDRVVMIAAGYASECWDPQYARDVNGYCNIKVRPDPRSKKAHRYAYEQMVGPIPNGLVLDHLCRNRWCCNPAHVEPVTQAENVLRGEGWAPRFKAQTHCHRGHEFTPENTHHGKRGRSCRACGAIRARLRYIPRRSA